MLAKITEQLGSWSLTETYHMPIFLWEHCTHIVIDFFFNNTVNTSYFILILPLKKLRLREGN